MTVSFVENLTATIPSIVNADHIVTRIASSEFAPLVGAVRSAAGKEASDQAKRRLPAILWSGEFSRRANDGLLQHSGLICADVDNLGQVEAARVRGLLSADPYCATAFLSPSAKGVKGVFRCDPREPHADAFARLSFHLENKYGLEIDQACKDVARLCFVSCDSSARWKGAGEILPPLPDFEETTLEVTKSHPSADTLPGEDFDARGDVGSLLKEHGWTHVGGTKWRRPGKQSGVSATLGGITGKRFYVFSSADQVSPFEPGKPYRPWHVFTLLVCSGDFSRAAKELAAKGYGKSRKTAPIAALPITNTSPPFAVSAPDSPASPNRANITPLTLWGPDEFLAFQPPADAEILGNYIANGEMTSFVGVGGLGKSRMALALALAQICGRQWCGLDTSKTPRRWLILNTEAGLRRWKNDLSRMLPNFSDAEQTLIRAHLRGLALTSEEPGVINAGDDASIGRLAATLSAFPPGVLVIDPFASTVDGDENSTADVIRTLAVISDLHRKHCPQAALVLVHHARSGAQNIAQAGDRFNAGNFGRGSKALYSRVRCEIQLAPADKDDSNKLVLACGKSNDAPPFETRGVRFDEERFYYELDSNFNLDDWRQDVAGKRVDRSVTVEDVVLCVRELAPCAGDTTQAGTIFKTLAQRLGVGRRTVERELRKAVDAGFLISGPKKGAYRLGHKPLPRSP